jgi:type IV pilus assembly protein PilX
MLSARHSHRGRRQHGIVLLLSLIVLIGMSLAAVALIRSVLTSNRVAGNLAFQQSATQSADAGVERAVAWLEQKSRELQSDNPPILANGLFNTVSAGGGNLNYQAARQDPGANQTWQTFWDSVLVANNQVNNLAADAAGNQVSFVIHRLCRSVGNALTSNCEAAPTLSASTQSSSKSSGIKLKIPSQTYYRITVRVTGPRNAVSFVQAVVAM